VFIEAIILASNDWLVILMLIPVLLQVISIEEEDNIFSIILIGCVSSILFSVLVATAVSPFFSY
jgi:ethanolamine transporter EutH